MTRLTHIAAFVLIALTLVLAACSNDSCYDNGSSLPLATLYMGNRQQSIPGLAIIGINAPGDSVLAQSSSIDEVYLPLRASVPQTSFALSRTITGDTATVIIQDTLTLDYKVVPYFHSAECGAMYNFDINNVSHTCHGIDSVVVLTPLVTNARVPALRIHFTDFSQ